METIWIDDFVLDIKHKTHFTFKKTKITEKSPMDEH